MTIGTPSLAASIIGLSVQSLSQNEPISPAPLSIDKIEENTPKMTNYSLSQRLSSRIKKTPGGVWLAICGFMGCAAANAYATTEYEPLEKIQKTAKIFLEEMTDAADNSNTKVEIGRLDPRLRFRRCGEPLHAFINGQEVTTGKLTVGIRCRAPVAWQVMIPATIEKFVLAVKLDRPVGRGQMIAAQDLKLEKVRLSQLREQPIESAALVVGAQAKRQLRPGQIIRKRDFCLVCKGEKVRVRVSSGNLVIEAEAVALTDGLKGEVISLQNERSRQRFEATVVAQGLLEKALKNSQRVAINQ